MKKITVYLSMIFLSLSFTTIGQISEELDKKNGFKYFKFGESFEKMKKDLVFFGELPTKEKFYDYKGKDVTDVLGVKFDELSLSFHKDKLVYLSMTFGSEYERYSEIRDKLEIAFGKPVATLLSFDNDPRIQSGMIWKGRKTQLSIFKFNNRTDDEDLNGEVVLEFQIIDKDKKILLDNF